jgi:RHS repeat-associated protein
LHYLTSIFLTLLFFLTGGNSAVAKNQVSSAPLGDLCNLAVDQEFLTTDCTEYTDKSDLDRQGTTNAKVFNTSLESLFRDSTSIHSFLISAPLGDLCALAVNSSSSSLTTDTYDANGNTTSSLITDHGSLGTNASDIYSFDNRLIRRTTPDGKTIDLTYTPDGHRLSKFITQNGLTQRLVHYLTDTNNPTGSAQVIEEKQPLDTTSPLKKVNLYGHDLIATESRSVGVSPTSSIYYQYDGLGSVRSISNATGDLQETYDYDAYGTLIGLTKRNASTDLLEPFNLSSTIPDLQSDYLYTGEQWDADLGMYFLRARYLNTNTGRFHTQDSYEGRNGEPLTLHKYLYANGNPAMFTDPSGNMSLMEGVAVASVVLSLVNAVQVGMNPTTFGVATVGFDLITLGAGKYITGSAKILNLIVKGARNSTFLKAIGMNKFVFLLWSKIYIRGTTLGLYTHISKLGLGLQANHINQVAAFRDIPEGLGLAIPLAGNAKSVGSQHYKFHKVMDDFWEAYRQKGTKFGQSIDELDYRLALVEALEAASQSGSDAWYIAEMAIRQAQHFGYFGKGARIIIPARTAF